MGFCCTAHLALQHELRAATCRSLLSMPDWYLRDLLGTLGAKNEFLHWGQLIHPSSLQEKNCSQSASGPIKELLGAVNSQTAASLVSEASTSHETKHLPAMWDVPRFHETWFQGTSGRKIQRPKIIYPVTSRHCSKVHRFHPRSCKQPTCHAQTTSKSACPLIIRGVCHVLVHPTCTVVVRTCKWRTWEKVSDDSNLMPKYFNRFQQLRTVLTVSFKQFGLCDGKFTAERTHQKTLADLHQTNRRCQGDFIDKKLVPQRPTCRHSWETYCSTWLAHAAQGCMIRCRCLTNAPNLVKLRL